MLIDAAASSPAGVFNAIGTWTLAFLGILAGLITAIKAPTFARRQRHTEERVEQIHELVNGNLTMAKAAELEATRRELVTLQEIARLHAQAGHSVSPDAEAEITRTQLRIAVLNSEVTERRARDQKLDERVKT